MDDSKKLKVQENLIDDLSEQVAALSQALEMEKSKMDALMQSNNELCETIESLKNLFAYKSNRLNMLSKECEENNKIIETLN